VCHHIRCTGPLSRRFPVRVVRRFGLSHSLHVDGDRVASAYRETPPEWPWIIHAAEGIDEEARTEVGTLGCMGCLGPNSVLVHGVAIDEERAAAVLQRWWQPGVVSDIQSLSVRPNSSRRTLQPCRAAGRLAAIRG
jgi:hypothetical protein